MRKETLVRIVVQTIPVLLGIVLTYLFWRNSFLLTLIYLAAIAIILRIKYYSGDLFALLYGFLLGILVEVIGTSVSGYQSFTNPDFLGIPLWLPIVWAYGLMAMKRIGIIIHEGYASARPVAAASAAKRRS